MTMTDDEGRVISEKEAIKAGLVIAQMDVSKMEDSDFKRGMITFQKLLFGSGVDNDRKSD